MRHTIRTLAGRSIAGNARGMPTGDKAGSLGRPARNLAFVRGFAMRMQRSLGLAGAILAVAVVVLGVASMTAAGPQQATADSATATVRADAAVQDHHTHFMKCAKVCADCAEACRLAATLAGRESQFAVGACDFCARCCDECASACEAVATDKHMAECAKACRDCAKACREVVKMVK